MQSKMDGGEKCLNQRFDPWILQSIDNPTWVLSYNSITVPVSIFLWSLTSISIVNHLESFQEVCLHMGIVFSYLQKKRDYPRLDLWAEIQYYFLIY